MVGDIPITGKFSREDLAAAINRREQLDSVELTALRADPSSASNRNLCTFTDQPERLAELSICKVGAACAGKKLFSAKVYLLGVLTDVDIYRLELAP
jgi:hypothetical protein